MAQDPEGQKKLEDLEERVDRAMADYVREHAEAAPDHSPAQQSDPGPSGVEHDHDPGRDDHHDESYPRASSSRSQPVDMDPGVR